MGDLSLTCAALLLDQRPLYKSTRAIPKGSCLGSSVCAAHRVVTNRTRPKNRSIQRCTLQPFHIVNPFLWADIIDSARTVYLMSAVSVVAKVLARRIRRMLTISET